MGRRGSGVRLGVIGAACALAVLGFAIPAGALNSLTAGASLIVSPDVGLVNGEGVNVSGAGLTPNQTGAILECNSDPGQPTVTYVGIAIPVSCSPIFGSPGNVIFSTIVSTSAAGSFSTTFIVHTGALGPPTSGTDSAGNDAGADAANYPCPPTPAQQAAGDGCYLVYGDLAGDVARAGISFGRPLSSTPVVSAAGGYEANGQPVQVTASGFAPDSPVLVEECNLTPGEPNNPVGFGPTVGCTPPFSILNAPFPPSTDSTGSLTTTFTLVEGNVGENAQSAAYPCPPSAANVALGGSCDIVVEDSGGNTGHGSLGLLGPVPVPSITATPSSGLLNGQQVVLGGSGFSANNYAFSYECNRTPGEPTVTFNGVTLPVGCSNPFTPNELTTAFGATGADGSVEADFTVLTGALGPPNFDTGPGTDIDSAGNDATADAAAFPCPPTPAQRARGASCDVTFVDDSGEAASTPISFGAPRTFSPNVAVLALEGALDQAAIPSGTEVVVDASGFTPDSPALVEECPYVPGVVTDPFSGLPIDCSVISDSFPNVTDEAGNLTTNATVESYTDYADSVTGASPCSGAPPAAPGTCDIVVVDAAGDVAKVPIGVTGLPAPVFTFVGGGGVTLSKP